MADARRNYGYSQNIGGTRADTLAHAFENDLELHKCHDATIIKAAKKHGELDEVSGVVTFIDNSTYNISSSIDVMEAS